MSLSVIIPCFQEEENIERAVRETFKAFKDEDFELIVVDDGSTDKTLEIVNNLKKELPIKVLHHKTNQGYGATISTSLKHINKKFFTILDADLQYKPEEVRTLYKVALARDNQAIGKTNKEETYTLIQLLRTKVYNLILLKLLFKIDYKDVDAVKILFSHPFKQVELQSKMYGVNVEMILLSHKAGNFFIEEPVNVYERAFGESKTNLSRIIKTIIEVIKCRRLL